MTGEGIAQALETGMLAAEAIAASGDPARGRARYRRAVAGPRPRPALRVAAAARARAPVGARAAIAAADLTPWTRRNFARWMFEDYPARDPHARPLAPRAVTAPGAYACHDAASDEEDDDGEREAEISIDTNPDEVWKLLRDFGGLADCMPGVDVLHARRRRRTLQMMGIEIKEQLREIDDDTRRLTYSVVESPMNNMVSHEATIAIDPEGSGSHITWSVAVEPADLLPIFQGAYDNAVSSLKTKFES